MKLKFFAATLLGALSVSAFAQAANKSDEKLPAPVQVAVSGGMKMEKSFPAAGGLTGWVLSQGVGQYVIVYTPPGGEVAIAGNMLDAKGQNLTRQYMEQHAPKPDYSKMWGELEKSAWVAEGASGKDVKSVVYVFKDANCSYCHLAWKALQAYETVGLQVRWVPVAFLAPDSYDKGAQLLAATDGNEAVKSLHAKWGSKYAVPAASKEARAKLEANNRLMNTWGFRGTPVTVFKDKSGKVQTEQGMFSMSDLPRMTGLPEQPQTDPALAKFR